MGNCVSSTAFASALSASFVFSVLKFAELLFDRICEVLRALMIPVVGLVSPVGDCLLNWISAL